jgi:hypothetical protein
MPFQLNAAAASHCATSNQHGSPVARARMIAAQMPSAAYSGPALMPIAVYDGIVGMPSSLMTGRATPAHAS